MSEAIEIKPDLSIARQRSELLSRNGCEPNVTATTRCSHSNILLHQISAFYRLVHRSSISRTPQHFSMSRKQQHPPLPTLMVLAKLHPSLLNLFTFCCFLLAIVSISSVPFLYFSHPACVAPHNSFGFSRATPTWASSDRPLWSGGLFSFPLAWNSLSFSPQPPAKRLNIALFVKKWPRADRAGGMERHALTLHLALAQRGHATHVFSAFQGSAPPPDDTPNVYYHLSKPSASGLLNQGVAWKQFLEQNASTPFDVIHSESVGLYHTRARGLNNVVVSWHGIAYESVHSDIAQDLARLPGEPRPEAVKSRLTDRVLKVIEEVKFFDHYAHHIATSDHVGDILRRIYMIPENRVHVILNGVDEGTFKMDVARGLAFRRKHNVPDSAKLVLGLSGRLVKDKGHPVMVEALRQMLKEDKHSLDDVFFLVAGDGPWGNRYKQLGRNFLVLGPLDRPGLSDFYNSLDVFVHPTLRAQGLDQTVLEAMLSGKPAMVSRFAGITESAVVSSEMGYVFSPKVERWKEGLRKVIGDGRKVLERKGEVARERALGLFTATKMASAYERLFLCMSSASSAKTQGSTTSVDYCKYPLPSD